LSATTDADRRGLSRREMFAGAAVATGAAIVADPGTAEAAAYPRMRIVALNRVRVNRPVHFDYPLKGQASALLDMGHAVPGGVGPKKSIVAYSILCQHMGCPVAYERAPREFACPCHQTRYDPERLAGIIQGVATRALPRVKLSVKNGAIFATGVDGLIYGYRNNLHPGKKAGGKS
jgi:arsenite oxidase small subunit